MRKKHINPSTVIKGESLIIGDLMDSGLFSMPPNQRDFVWGLKHLEQMFNDFVEFYDSMTSNDELNDPAQLGPYYLGAIVVVKSSTTGRLEVIDGQQRLTSLSCLY